jgi:hypothetical protein
MRERDIEDYLVKRVNAMGGEVRKVKWIGRRGAPDRLVMLPQQTMPAWDGVTRPGAICNPFPWTRAARTIWVELKAPGVEPESHQVREHMRMRAMGQRVEVIDSLAGVEELLG